MLENGSGGNGSHSMISGSYSSVSGVGGTPSSSLDSATSHDMSHTLFDCTVSDASNDRTYAPTYLRW